MSAAQRTHLQPDVPTVAGSKLKTMDAKYGATSIQRPLPRNRHLRMDCSAAAVPAAAPGAAAGRAAGDAAAADQLRDAECKPRAELQAALDTAGAQLGRPAAAAATAARAAIDMAAIGTGRASRDRNAAVSIAAAIWLQSAMSK